MAQNANLLFDSTPVPLAVATDEVAELLGISRTHVWRFHGSGRLPSPVRFGRAERWGRQVATEWLAAAVPSREKWEELKKAGRNP